MAGDDGAALVGALKQHLSVIERDVGKEFGGLAMITATDLGRITGDRQRRPCEEQPPEGAVLLMAKPFERCIVSEPFAQPGGAVRYEVRQLRVCNLRRLKQHASLDDIHADE